MRPLGFVLGWLGLEETIQEVQGLPVQLPVDALGECDFMPLEGGIQDALAMLIRRRLHPKPPAPLVHGVDQAVGTVLLRNDLLDEPALQGLLIRNGELTEPAPLADLSTVPLDRSSFPWVAIECLRIHLNLASHKAKDHRRDVSRIAREAALRLKELQEKGESEAGCPRLVLQEPSLGWPQEPRLRQVIFGPRPFHPSLPDCTS